MYVYKSVAKSRVTNAHHIIHSALTGPRSPAGPRRLRARPKAAEFAVLIPGPGIFVNVQLVSRVMIPPPSEMPPVSPCEPLCAILLRKASVYPLSLVKANVGRLCEKLKSAMRSGLKQRCNGNFLAIFVEVDLGEKPNFTGRFLEWRRPFDFSTDRL